MARIPTAADLGERPTPTPQLGLVRYQGGDASSFAAPGLALAEVAGEFGKEVKIQQDRIDTLRAEDAFNQMRSKQLDLSVGEGGFERQKGADAVTKPIWEDYTKRYNEQRDLIASTLANDEQKQRFLRRSAVSELQFKEGLLRHMAREGDVYAGQVFEGITGVELQNATAQWNNPMAVALSIERTTAAVDQLARDRGLPAARRADLLLEQTSKIHSSVITQAIANNQHEYAQKWYETYKGQIDKTTASVVARAVEEGAQKQAFNTYQRDFLGARDNRKALEQLERTVTDDPKLDDTRKLALQTRISNQVMVLDNKAEIAHRRWVSKMEGQVNEALNTTLAGYPAKLDQLGPLISAARGTEVEGKVQQLVAVTRATEAFRLSNPQQQEQAINQAELAVRNEPGKVDVRILNTFKTIHENQKRQAKEDPISFAARQGLVDVKPLDTSSAAALAPGLTERFAIARGMSQRYNSAVKPLTEEEAAATVATLTRAKIDEKQAFFGMVAAAAGNDYQGYRAVMAQIAPDNPVLAHAGIAANRDRASKDGLRLSTLLLQGQEILNPNKKEDGRPASGKLLPMPDDKKMQLEYDDYVRGAFAGNAQARSDYYQASRAVYAKLSADAGDRDTSVLDASRWRQSIELATGGIHEYRGKQTVVPWGYTEGQFEDALNSRITALGETKRLAEGMTVGKVRQLPVEPVGDGRYVFRAGDGILVDKNNRPIIIDFNQSVPFKTSGGSGLAVPALQQPSADELEAAQKPARMTRTK